MRTHEKQFESFYTPSDSEQTTGAESLGSEGGLYGSVVISKLDGKIAPATILGELKLTADTRAYLERSGKRRYGKDYKYAETDCGQDNTHEAIKKLLENNGDVQATLDLIECEIISANTDGKRSIAEDLAITAREIRAAATKVSRAVGDSSATVMSTDRYENRVRDSLIKETYDVTAIIDDRNTQILRILSPLEALDRIQNQHDTSRTKRVATKVGSFISGLFSKR